MGGMKKNSAGKHRNTLAHYYIPLVKTLNLYLKLISFSFDVSNTPKKYSILVYNIIKNVRCH